MKLNDLINDTNYKHSQQVAEISVLLAEYAGISAENCEVIKQAALLHDIGKSKIPSEILNKPEKLTNKEFEIVKKHADLGYMQIKEVILILELAATIAKYHHERPDGQGYHNISEIHPYARLIAVADVFDALYSKRVYKPAWGLNDIQSFFVENSGTQFDPAYVNLLIKNLDKIERKYKNSGGIHGK